jgi:hypothetical protein
VFNKKNGAVCKLSPNYWFKNIPLDTHNQPKYDWNTPSNQREGKRLSECNILIGMED